MLKSFAAILQARGLTTHLIVASAAAPLDQLVVVLDPDEKGRERNLWLTPLPHLEDDLDAELSLLQFLATLPFQANAKTESTLAKRILELNNALPLGCFGLHQPESAVLYRCVLMLGPDAITNGQIVSETVTLITFLLDQFSNAIEDATRD